MMEYDDGYEHASTLLVKLLVTLLSVIYLQQPLLVVEPYYVTLYFVVISLLYTDSSFHRAFFAASLHSHSVP